VGAELRNTATSERLRKKPSASVVSSVIAVPQTANAAEPPKAAEKVLAV
jgi:hypothetical protein